jgi:hypothetical protein
MTGLSEPFAAIPGEWVSELSFANGKTESYRTEPCEARDTGTSARALGADPVSVMANGPCPDRWRM